MPNTSLMTPSTASFSELLGNGVTYQVPTFQRDYSWKMEHWSDLWEDIKQLLQTGKEHYMGAVVFQKIGDKSFLVIDGQQRLTTLSIVALAVIKTLQDLIEKNIEPADNHERIQELRRAFLGQKDPASLLYSSKLLLNENNDPFYQRNLLQLNAPSNEKTLLDSDRLLWQSFDFFCQKIHEYFPQPSGAELAGFLSKIIGDKTVFIKIEVEDELSAYSLFETLNYRGVGLTVGDLLKNYLFSLITPSDLRIAKQIWKKIANSVGIDQLPVFLHHFWVSRKPSIKQEHLFKAIRNDIKNNQQVFELLNHLDQYAEIYLALQDPYSLFWTGNRERIKRIKELKLFGLSHPIPLLMTAKERFSDGEFDKLLRIVTVLTFRYHVVGNRHLQKMEELFNMVSQKIHHGSLRNAQDVAQELKPLYISDEDFKHDFSNLELFSFGKQKKMLRYILFELENHLMQGGNRDYEADPATIEHILPQNPATYWDDFFPKNMQEKYLHRLGNYTLLEDQLNKDAENLSFEQKKSRYAKSQYDMTKAIQQHEWNPSTLEARQRDLSKKALSAWKVALF